MSRKGDNTREPNSGQRADLTKRVVRRRRVDSAGGSV